MIRTWDDSSSLREFDVVCCSYYRVRVCVLYGVRVRVGVVCVRECVCVCVCCACVVCVCPSVTYVMAVEALTDDINAMLDKLKSVDEQSRG
jgi:hypothetical protein